MFRGPSRLLQGGNRTYPEYWRRISHGQILLHCGWSSRNAFYSAFGREEGDRGRQRTHRGDKPSEADDNRFDGNSGADARGNGATETVYFGVVGEDG